MPVSAATFEQLALEDDEKSLIAWRRKPDGSCSESRYDGGTVIVESLPDVSIRLEQLFR